MSREKGVWVDRVVDMSVRERFTLESDGLLEVGELE